MVQVQLFLNSSKIIAKFQELFFNCSISQGTSNMQHSRYKHVFSSRVENSVDPDQMATMFSKKVQQDKGYISYFCIKCFVLRYH